MRTAYIGLGKLRLALGDKPEGIARILREHWRAAASLRPYWLASATWLQVRPFTARLTSGQVAAGSSGTPQDQHPC